MELANKKLLALITGSTGGFGRSIAHALTETAVRLGASSLTLILHSRRSSKTRFPNLSECLLRIPGLEKISLKLVPLHLDLETDKIPLETKRVLQNHSQELDYALLFNNAGILRASRVVDEGFSVSLTDTLKINVTAPAEFALAFLESVPEDAARCIVHTSSLASLKMFRTWGSYCVSKAAGDMLHAMVAAECPSVRVLSYSPGPMKTAMTKGVAKCLDVDPEIRALYALLESEDRFVCCKASAGKLLHVLMENKYKSGEHIDFYDK